MGTLEPLQAVAQQHKGGQEEYARKVATGLLESFLVVEEHFQSSGAATEQEVIDALRQVRQGIGFVAQTKGSEHLGDVTAAQYNCFIGVASIVELWVIGMGSRRLTIAIWCQHC